MIQFVFGAIAGAVAAWYWRHDIDEKMPNLRTKAADRLQSMERTAEGMIDKAKTNVVRRMRAGEDKLRGGQEQGAGGTSRTGTMGGQSYGTGGYGTTTGQQGTGYGGTTGGSTTPSGGYGGTTGGQTQGGGGTTGQGHGERGRS
jgi:hypothetical protein